MQPPSIRNNGGARREVILGLLVAAYVVVAVVAHSDYPREAADTALTDLEVSGLAVWRKNNCQSCHQIYGFGGFLGLDLTNRIDEDVEDIEFWQLFRNGYGNMPPLKLSQEDRKAVLAFLRAVNRTGRSQPRPLGSGRQVHLWEQYQLVTAEWEERNGTKLDARVRSGREVWTRSRCGTCHSAFVRGLKRAPDLSGSALDRSSPWLEAILSDGTGNMPAYELSRDEVEQLSVFLEWVAARRRELVDLNDELMDREDFSWASVPWFEYR